MTTLVWFRLDLRLADNPALTAALEIGAPIVPVFIFAPAEEGGWMPGGAARWWLHQSLCRLDEALRRCGSRLTLRAAPDSLSELPARCPRMRRDAGSVEPPLRARADRARSKIKAALRAADLETRSYNSALLHEPWEARTQSGETVSSLHRLLAALQVAARSR